jgi:selenocysteine-specific elongation factor
MLEVTARHFIIATAGHVDHGKSALVKALTGTDPDRLPEEKKRQITIDLGFAELNLPVPNGGPIHAGIIDVPGHEDFVRNMIAGVGSTDLALFVVAADDGWMPQSEEHLQILTYLGVQRAVIALTKSDLGLTDRMIDDVQDHLRGTAFTGSPIIPTSVRTGAGIEKLKTAIASQLTTIHPPRDLGKPRLFIDRIFTLRGVGTVVTGTLNGGTLRRGQNVVVQPRTLSARVRSIQNHGREIDVAQPGMRTAMNLPDISMSQSAARRGDVITVDEFGSANLAVDVVVERSSRLQRNALAARRVNNGSSVHVHFGTTRTAARIAFLDRSALEVGQNAIAQLRLNSPILAFVGDRFILRDSSEQTTIAGGTVLDPDANGANFRSARQIEFLRARATNPRDIDVCIRSQLKRDLFVESKMLLLKSNFSDEEIHTALNRLRQQGVIVLTGDIAADASHWHDLLRKAASVIDRRHKQNPERRGVELSDLRAELRIQSDKLFNAVVSDLTRRDFEKHENQIARVSHRPSLPRDLLSAAENIRAALSAKAFDPPDRKMLTQDRQSQQALRFLIDQGEVVEISRDIIVLERAAEQMQKAIADFLQANGSGSASQLRQKIGTTRRVIIPFLEYLDRIAVTRRVGDRRVLANNSAAAKLTDDGPITQRI